MIVVPGCVVSLCWFSGVPGGGLGKDLARISVAHFGDFVCLVCVSSTSAF